MRLPLIIVVIMKLFADLSGYYFSRNQFSALKVCRAEEFSAAVYLVDRSVQGEMRLADHIVTGP